MFNRTKALELLAATFPEEDITSKDYLNGGERTVHWDADLRLRQMIDLAQPEFDVFKTDQPVSEELEQRFRRSVEHDYKNEHGLWP